MATLEAEAFLLGHWKNIEEMEANMTLEELEMILKAEREKEERHNRFMAALRGINLDEGRADVISAQDKVEDMKRRAEAQKAGKSSDEFDMEELGLEIQVEE